MDETHQFKYKTTLARNRSAGSHDAESPESTQAEEIKEKSLIVIEPKSQAKTAI